MNNKIFCALSLVCFPTVVSAQVTTYNSSSEFHAANPGASLIEDFEDSPLAMRDTELINMSYTGPGGEITFTPLASYPFLPNLVLTSPGRHEYAADQNPTTSMILAVTGNEDFIATLATPAYALGFDVYTNDWPLSISFYNGETLLTTLMYDDPQVIGDNHTFAGITSVEGITGFHWVASNGQYWNTGIDNIYAGPMTALRPGDVPEPATWAMMLFGFGAIGLLLRQKKRALALALS